jgi:diguanylate cyclase (GGDEF)-like protein
MPRQGWRRLFTAGVTVGLALLFLTVLRKASPSSWTWYLPALGLLLLVLELSLMATRWRDASVRDPLTGLFNRRHLSERLAWEIRRSQRRQAPVSLIIIDVDDFKRFNDRHGHAVGDAVLIAMANLLQETVRQSDWCARWGGEEFAVILPDTDLDGAVMVAERLRSRVQNLRLREFGNLRPTISAGVATCPVHAVAAQDLMNLADTAMYQAKQQKNRVLVAPLPGDPLPPDSSRHDKKRVARTG